MITISPSGKGYKNPTTGAGNARRIKLDDNGNVIGGAVPKSSIGKNIKSLFDSEKNKSENKNTKEPVAKQDIKSLRSKVLVEKDWNKRGEIVKEGLKMSAQYMIENGFMPKPEKLNEVVDTLLKNRGNGWFSEQWNEMIVSPKNQQEAISYLTSWVNSYKKILSEKENS